MPGSSAYDPNSPLRRPGGKPPFAPRSAGITSRPTRAIRRTSPAAARSRGSGTPPHPTAFSRVYHYRPNKVWRVDYRYTDTFTDGADGDAHAVTRILRVGRSTATT